MCYIYEEVFTLIPSDIFRGCSRANIFRGCPGAKIKIFISSRIDNCVSKMSLYALSNR